MTQSLAVTVGKKPTITSAASATFVAGKAVLRGEVLGLSRVRTARKRPATARDNVYSQCERNGHACGYADLNRHAGQLPVVHKRRQCRGHCYSSLHTDTHTAPGILKRLSYDIYGGKLCYVRTHHFGLPDAARLRRARYLGARRSGAPETEWLCSLESRQRDRENVQADDHGLK